MKAAVLSEYNKVEWLDVDKPTCKPGEVLIQVNFGCICGSDQDILKPEALISQTLHGSQTQRGFEILDENPAENIKILLDFRT
jgi:threonine dehydrogenase-like Zn-dependent dehydrogenase